MKIKNRKAENKRRRGREKRKIRLRRLMTVSKSMFTMKTETRI